MLEGATRIKEDPCLILGRFSRHLISVFVLRPLYLWRFMSRGRLHSMERVADDWLQQPLGQLREES